MTDHIERDPIEVFARAAAHTRTLIVGVAMTQMGHITPLPGWDLARLIDHLGDIAAAGAEVFKGERPGAGQDAITRYDDAVRAFIEGGCVPDTMGKTLATFMGEMTGGQLAMALAMDNLVHGWDLAKATGQDTDLPAEVVAAVFATYAPDVESAIEPAPTTEQLRGYGSLGPEVPVADYAPMQDRLLGLMGRTP